MSQSRIEWTETTWNPVTGCTKISSGCQNCYAERMAKRLHAMGQANYSNGFNVTCHPDMLSRPCTWIRSRMVFVNSMSDLFHDNVPESFIHDVFEVMNKVHWHQYQVLTKRSKRLSQLASSLSWSKNIWMGVTVESDSHRDRLDDLAGIPASIRFLSLEPLLSSLCNLNLSNVDWVIVGGESGPGARPVYKDWIRDIRDQCITQNTPFFFKQWGGVNKKKAGRHLDGHIWDQMPRALH
jgi:protein gp37